jgi:3-deoxy-D-manno-octulosonate 8-phosphate phosphatase KdsC-like HAD superfamily phosphatase
VSDRPGGKGCIRDAFEKVMKAQGRWTFNPRLYKKMF